MTKKIYLLLLAVFLLLAAQSRSQTNKPIENRKHFYFGVSYILMSMDMKLTDMTLHTIWAGQDMGTNEITDEEINDLNSFAERTTTVGAVCLEAGIQIFNKPQSEWHIDGTVSLGLAHTQNTIYNQNTEQQEYAYNSGFSKPIFGLGFNITYHFTPTWGFTVRPLLSATMGSSLEITDNINRVPENFTQVLDDKYSTFYERISLLGSFKSGNIKLFAGPGFYRLHSNHEYIIERTNISNGEVVLDEINTKTSGRSFIDGNIAFEWRIYEPLLICALAGVGQDIFIKTGLYLNF